MKTQQLFALALALAPAASGAQQASPKPEDTEVWTPVPAIVTPGASSADAPSDAIRLFDGTSLGEWVTAGTSDPARWTVHDGVLTVNKQAGDIQTRRSFRNYQLHLEWRIPLEVTGSGQLRGNSGVFLARTPNTGFELQVLDSYENTTYVNGQAGSIYKQSPPLVNAMRKPGEWQVYDVVWTAPPFRADGTVRTPARVTVLHNGVLVQNDFALRGSTPNVGQPVYTPFDSAPIALQAHGDPSPPISFRNIWIRELP